MVSVLKNVSERFEKLILLQPKKRKKGEDFVLFCNCINLYTNHILDKLYQIGRLSTEHRTKHTAFSNVASVCVVLIV